MQKRTFLESNMNTQRTDTQASTFKELGLSQTWYYVLGVGVWVSFQWHIFQ
jgi:hypothetical protein